MHKNKRKFLNCQKRPIFKSVGLYSTKEGFFFKIFIFWDMTPWRLVYVRTFWGTCCLHVLCNIRSVRITERD